MTVHQFPSIKRTICPPQFQTVPVSIGTTEYLLSDFPFVSNAGRFGYSSVTVERLETLLSTKFTIISEPIALNNARGVHLSSETKQVAFLPAGCTEKQSLHLSPDSSDDEAMRWYETIRKYFDVNVSVPYDLCESCSDIVLLGYSDDIDDDFVHQKLSNYIDRDLLSSGFFWSDSFDSIPVIEKTQCVACNTNIAVRRCNAKRSV